MTFAESRHATHTRTHTHTHTHTMTSENIGPVHAYTL